MLKKKEYTAILGLAKSRGEIAALFNSLFSPTPAVRIVKQTYHRHNDNDYEFLCDKCGKGFVAKSSKQAEHEKDLCVCPHCGYSICFKPSTYYNPKDEYALEEHCLGYNRVFTDIPRLRSNGAALNSRMSNIKSFFPRRRKRSPRKGPDSITASLDISTAS